MNGKNLNISLSSKEGDIVKLKDVEGMYKLEEEILKEEEGDIRCFRIKALDNQSPQEDECWTTEIEKLIQIPK